VPFSCGRELAKLGSVVCSPVENPGVDRDALSMAARIPLGCYSPIATL
jgi:hypothetical protein